MHLVIGQYAQYPYVLRRVPSGSRRGASADFAGLQCSPSEAVSGGIGEGEAIREDGTFRTSYDGTLVRQQVAVSAAAMLRAVWSLKGACIRKARQDSNPSPSSCNLTCSLAPYQLSPRLPERNFKEDAQETLWTTTYPEPSKTSCRQTPPSSLPRETATPKTVFLLTKMRFERRYNSKSSAF